VDGALRLLEQQFRSRDVALVRRMEAGSDAIMGDADQLGQAFVNLFLNAVEAMDSGGELTVLTEVAPGASPSRGARSGNGDALRVSIRDTGPGIAPENVGRVFDPFFTTKGSGTGLGLAVTHRIIQEHGGSIDVESEMGRGTSFHLLFPLAGGETA
jgi:signal transduction histidine kinase